MSIPSVTEVGRVPSSTTSRTPAAAATATARQGGASTTASSATGDEATPARPTPPRFPWLSRLSQQLESVAKQKPAFPSAPVLGDNVDRSA
ncbi:MAG: hypothetical protein ABI781_06695 [Burkholderiales bacterium]